jgi:hypothetical protein
MVDAILHSDQIPKRERIEFAFEDQKEFVTARASTFSSFRNAKEFKTHHGKSRVAKDSSMEKGPLLEASDYLAHAILQQLLDPSSQKAALTAPILELNQPIQHTEVTNENIDDLIETVFEGEEIPTMDRDVRAHILEQMRKNLKKGQ